MAEIINPLLSIVDTVFLDSILSVDEMRQILPSGCLATTGATPLMRISRLYKEWDAVRSRHVSSQMIYNNEIALIMKLPYCCILWTSYAFENCLSMQSISELLSLDYSQPFLIEISQKHPFN
mgnify:CR=1 FL=1